MADNPINMFDPWGASEKSGGKSKGKDGGSSTSSSSGNSSSPSGGKSGGKSGSSSGGKSGGGISPKSINKDPDKFKEGERLFSGPFETDLMFHGGLFYNEQKYRSLVQDLVDSYGDGKAFDEKLSTFANENGFSENFIEIYAEQGRETYGGNEKIGDLGLKNPFINFGLKSNDFDVIAIASVFGLAKNGIKYFLSRATGRGTVTGEGVYDLGTTLGKYIGQSKDIMKRVNSHFAKGGKLTAGELSNAVFHSMPGSTRLQREVYEQYLITKYGGPKSGLILNKRNPMGGRMNIYDEMIDDVIKQFNLPR